MLAPAPPETQKGQRAISIFGLGSLQRSPFVSTVDRVNAVVEMTENGRQQAAIFGMPGLESAAAFGIDVCRAFFIREGELILYFVVLDRITRLPLGGSPTVLGTFTTTTGPVWITDNGTQIFINDGVTAYIYNTSTSAWAQVTDADYPVNARGGTFLQGRFWVYTTSGASAGRVYGSDQFNGLAWDGLNFFTPEATPDGIAGIDRWFNDLIVFGKSSIEWWSGVSVQIAGQLGFQPIAGANTEVGLIGELAYGRAGQRLLFLGRSNGQAGIYEIKNYSALKISPPAVDADLAPRTNRATAIATGYMVAGHPIVQFSFRGATAIDAITWAIDLLSDSWCRRVSFGRPYYRGLIAATTLERIFIADAFTGIIYEMKDSIYTEGSDPLIFEVTGIHLLKEGDVLTVHAVQIDLETGLGAAGANPQAIIQISKDGGHTWSSEAWVTMIGKTGEYKRRVRRRRIGSARDIAIKLRITDPVKRVVTGAYLVLEAGLS
jgi:hypothetical protein